MSNPYTDQTTASPVLNFYTDASQLTTQANPSVTELHMIPAGGVSLPSDRYIDFTLPASGNDYTALADGWILVSKRAGGSNQYMLLVTTASDNHGVTYYGMASGVLVRSLIPVNASSSVNFTYTLSGETVACRFIYANGSPNVSA